MTADDRLSQLLRSEADLISLLRLYRRVHRSTQIAGFLGFAFDLLRRFSAHGADDVVGLASNLLGLPGSHVFTSHR